jgi:lysozyme family protein
MKSNFDAFLTLVWALGNDDPADGYHITPGDTGLGTNGGVTEKTWAAALSRGLVTGPLKDATRDQLATVLQDGFWGSVCDALPGGLDLMFGNGRMMTGHYPELFQQALGFVGGDVDGLIGPMTLEAAHNADVTTLIRALTGIHYAYLSRLPVAEWKEFQGGWTRRLLGVQGVALKLLNKPAV